MIILGFHIRFSKLEGSPFDDLCKEGLAFWLWFIPYRFFCLVFRWVSCVEIGGNTRSLYNGRVQNQ